MFREHIQKVVDRLDGCVGGVVMGFDGIAVESPGTTALLELIPSRVGEERRSGRDAGNENAPPAGLRGRGDRARSRSRVRTTAISSQPPLRR